MTDLRDSLIKEGPTGQEDELIRLHHDIVESVEEYLQDKIDEKLSASPQNLIM